MLTNQDTAKIISGKIDPSNHVLIFTRLPKTAGTTLVQEIIYPYYRGTKKIHSNIWQMRGLPEDVRHTIDITGGHIHYGVHQWLRHPYLYIAMLREPLDRTLSHFYFVRQVDSHKLHILANQHTLLSYLNREDADRDCGNIMTKLLSGSYTGINNYGVVHREGDVLVDSEEELLAMAMTNLTTCVVGITEHFDLSLQLYGYILRWSRVLSYEHRRVTPNRPKVQDLSPDELSVLQHHNRLDIQLYQFAGKLFREQRELAGLI